MRVVFMGTPDFAVPSLLALTEVADVAGVLSQPDRPAGRGRSLQAPPVARLAHDLGLPLVQPSNPQSAESMAAVTQWAPDVIIVAAYGRILKPALLNLPPHGCVNVHASLLPRWRGASPVQAAILHGDARTGVTLMRLDPGMDTGPILAQKSTPILEDETAGELEGRLAHLGADLLQSTLPDYLLGECDLIPQDESLATHAPILKKSDGLLHFSQSAEELARQVRAFHPWPGSYFHWGKQRIVVHQASALDMAASAPPGHTLETTDGLPAVQTSHGVLLLRIVQPSGKRPMPAEAFLNGARDFADTQLDPPTSP